MTTAETQNGSAVARGRGGGEGGEWVQPSRHSENVQYLRCIHGGILVVTTDHSLPKCYGGRGGTGKEHRGTPGVIPGE